LSIPIYFGQGRTRQEIQKEIDERQTQIEQFEKEAERYRGEVEEAQSAGRTLQTEIKIYDASIRELQRDISATQQKISKANLEIEGLDLEITTLDEKIDTHRKTLETNLQAMYEDIPPNIVEFILMQKNISAVFGAMEYRQYLNEEIYSNLIGVKTVQENRTQERRKQASVKKTLQVFNTQLSIQKGSETQEKKERETILQKTKNEEKKFKALLVQSESLRKKAQDEILALEETLQLLVDPSRLPQKRSGVLAWPLMGRTSQGYGNTPFSRSSGFYSVHNGIDISGKVGAPVHSAEYGKVLGVGDTDSFCKKAAYGKWILIEHENNLATLYAHLSKIDVTPGQTITRGALVGYVGNTGLTTGPHLHLTVYDAKTARIKQSNVCGPLPIGGHVNPLDYL
jgi:murein DD-endopeptidase MepM/ murein hydrolase activator NlpD